MSEWLSRAYEDLKVKHWRMKQKAQMIYEYNNLLIAENDKLKKQISELQKDKNELHSIIEQSIGESKASK